MYTLFLRYTSRQTDRCSHRNTPPLPYRGRSIVVNSPPTAKCLLKNVVNRSEFDRVSTKKADCLIPCALVRFHLKTSVWHSHFCIRPHWVWLWERWMSNRKVLEHHLNVRVQKHCAVTPFLLFSVHTFDHVRGLFWCGRCKYFSVGEPKGIRKRMNIYSNCILSDWVIWWFGSRNPLTWQLLNKIISE